MQLPEPRAEHRWLERLLGDWQVEADCAMAPGEPTTRVTWREAVRPLGPLWVVAEGTGTMPDGSVSRTVMTLGFDDAAGAFVGTFVAAMMTHLWVYRGTLDPTRDALTLSTEGPSMAAPGQTVPYRETIAFQGPDQRVFTSEMQGADGVWVRVMRAAYSRGAG